MLPSYATSCDLCICEARSCYVRGFGKRCIFKKIHHMTLTWVKVTQNVVQYPLHHVTYAHVSFEVATSNDLGVLSYDL